MLARESLGRYQSKVKELYGPDTHQHVIDELCKEDLDEVHVASSGFFGSETLDFEGAVGWTKHDDMDFCPKCSEKYDSMMKDFLSCKEN